MNCNLLDGRKRSKRTKTKRNIFETSNWQIWQKFSIAVEMNIHVTSFEAILGKLWKLFRYDLELLNFGLILIVLFSRQSYNFMLLLHVYAS